MSERRGIERRFSRAADAAECSSWSTVDGTTLRIAGSGVQIEELREFYTPYYQLHGEAPAEARGEVLIAPPRANGDLEGATTDMRVFLRPSSPTVVAGRFACFRRPVTGIDVVCDRRDGRVLLGGGRPIELALQARTLIRDQVFRQLEKRRGSVVFHAAAIEVNGVGVAFAGVRDSGKTASLLAFLAARKASLISCDRVKLSAGHGGSSVAVSGMPARCNIHRVALRRDPFLRPLAERERIRYDREGKALIDARSIVRLAGCEQVAAAPLGAVVFPEIVSADEPLAAEPVGDRDELRRLMRENVMEGSRADRHVHWLGWIPDPPTTLEERIERVLDALGEGVGSVRVRGGYESYVRAIADGSLDLLGLAGAPAA